MGSKYGLVRWRVTLAVLFLPLVGCAWQPSGPGIAYTRGSKPPALRKVSRPGEYARGRETEVELPGRLTTRYRWELITPAPPPGAVAAQP